MVSSYYWGVLEPKIAYSLFICALGFVAVVIFAQNYSSYHVDRSQLIPHLKENWQLGKWAVLGNFAYMGSRFSYPWIILYCLDYEAVAAYYACLALSVAPSPLLRGAGAYILPRMSHGYKEGSSENLKRLLKKSIMILSVPYLSWLLLGSLLSEQIIQIF